MAFSRSPTLDRSLCGLCQYPVKNQEGISWVAQLVPDHGSKTGVYSSLPGAGGDPLRRQPDGEKSRTQSQSQVSAQQVPVLCSFFVLSFHPFSSLFFLLGVFWGKFGDRVNKPTTITIKDPSHLFSLLSNAALDVSTLRLCTDDILEATYTSVHDNAVKGTKTNVSVAPFTTCPARLKLYTSL